MNTQDADGLVRLAAWHRQQGINLAGVAARSDNPSPQLIALAADHLGIAKELTDLAYPPVLIVNDGVLQPDGPPIVRRKPRSK